jgi:hypothetical protein
VIKPTAGPKTSTMRVVSYHDPRPIAEILAGPEYQFNFKEAPAMIAGIGTHQAQVDAVVRPIAKVVVGNSTRPPTESEAVAISQYGESVINKHLVSPMGIHHIPPEVWFILQ